MIKNYIPVNGSYYCATAGKREVRVFGKYDDERKVVSIFHSDHNSQDEKFHLVEDRPADTFSSAERAVEEYFLALEDNIERDQLEEVLSLFAKKELPPPLATASPDPDVMAVSYVDTHIEGDVVIAVVLRRYLDEYEDVKCPKIVIAIGDAEEIFEYIEFFCPGAMKLDAPKMPV